MNRIIHKYHKDRQFLEYFMNNKIIHNYNNKTFNPNLNHFNKSSNNSNKLNNLKFHKLITHYNHNNYYLNNLNKIISSKIK